MSEAIWIIGSLLVIYAIFLIGALTALKKLNREVAELDKEVAELDREIEFARIQLWLAENAEGEREEMNE